MGERNLEPTQEQRFEQKVSNKTGEIARDRVPQRQAEIDRSYVLHSKRIYWICRRTQDVLLSAIALLVLWPFMLVIAGVIWLDSPGASPIFAQERIGRDGKPFMFLNLRCMQVIHRLHNIMAYHSIISCSKSTMLSRLSDFRHSSGRVNCFLIA